MMPDPASAMLLIALLLIVLAAVYLYSRDPARRRRAWRLLRLLLGK